MVELTPVQSSNVAAVGYDHEAQELHVEFKGGGMYIYEGVPPDVAAQVQGAPSVGKAINEHCKDCFDFRKV